MKIGDEVWLFSLNWREYTKGQSVPIYSSHFRKFKIESETSRSWILNGIKFPKNNPVGIYTDKQKDDAIWDHENRYKIIIRVEKCSIDTLLKIATVLDEKDKEVCIVAAIKCSVGMTLEGK